MLFSACPDYYILSTNIFNSTQKGFFVQKYLKESFNGEFVV